MLKVLSFVILSAISYHASATQSCLPDGGLSAKYQITHQWIPKHNHDHGAHFHGDEKGREVSETFILWRKGNQAALEKVNKRITEIWEQTKNKRLKVTRYFEDHKRGIEYQPDEINKGKDETDWSIKQQLISDRLLKEMFLSQSSGSGCDKKRTYTFKQGDVSLKVVWLPEQKLIKEFSKVTPSSKDTWTLIESNSDGQVVDSFFAQRNDYYTTDYADIGDNETDPFLINMINLGFLDHGASGFYDAKGNALGGGHHH